jgi:hypothetical protein
MTLLNVELEVPTAIAEGLDAGIYERVGGMVRESGSKQTVAWLRDAGTSGGDAAKELTSPPLPNLPPGEAAQLITPLLSAVNLGVSVAGFAVVITQLNQVSDQIRLIEAKVDRVSVKLDDLILAKLKAGVNACVNAVELNDPALRLQMAVQALTTLHEARQYFNQQVVRSAATVAGR